MTKSKITKPGQAHGEMRIQTMQASFSGPLPPPSTLERYDEIVPGAANRILLMAESQHAHRQGLESSVVRANVADQRLGVIFGFIVAMTATVGGIYLIATDKQIYGLASIITSLAALVGVFVYGRISRRKELDRKRPTH